MPFRTIAEGIENLSTQTRAELAKEMISYVPLLGGRLAASIEGASDLGQAFEDFTTTQNPKKVYVLFGNAGSGKSLFLHHLTQKLWEGYTPGRSIPLLISLAKLKKPIGQAVEETLSKYGFSEEQITELKAHHSFIFIMDGYDELYTTHNLYFTNKLSTWKAKTIISCRTQYLYNKKDTNIFFMPIHGEKEQPHLLSTLFVAPFNQMQVEQYLSLMSQQLESVPSYVEIADISGLKELITTPFLLSMVVKILPQILARYGKDVEQYERLTQTALYDLFLENWFLRQEGKLGVTSVDSDTKMMFWRYSQSLALDMARHNVTWIRSDDERFSVYFEQDTETEQIRSACPLIIEKDGIGFWHLSLNTYFTSKAISEEESKELSETTDYTSSNTTQITQEPLTGMIHERLFTHDISWLQKSAERLEANPRLKEQYYRHIEHSKTDARYATAAANAISILNYARESFSNIDFRGIRIPFANLSGAMLDHTNLSNADLTGVDLSNAWLRRTNFKNARMKDVIFGEEAFIQDEDDVHCIAYNANGEFLASGKQNGVVTIWSTANNNLYRKLQGHTDSVGTLAFSPTDNFLLATGSHDNSIRLWNINQNNALKILRGHGSWVEAVAFSYDGKVLASCDHTIYLWDVNSGTPLYQTTSAMGLNCRNLYISGNVNQRVVRVWDKSQNKTVPQEGIPFDDVEGVRRLSESVPPMFDPSTASIRDTMEFFGELPKTGLLAGHLSKITSICFNSKKNILASGSADNTIRLWKLEKNGLKYSLDCYEVLTGHTENVQWLSFNPNGDLLASGSDDQSVRLWHIDEESEEVQCSILSSDEKIKNVHFGPDGQLLIVAAGETIHFWDVISGQKLHSNTTDHAALSGLAVHPKGHIIASSGSSDWSVKFWYLNAQSGFSNSEDTFYTSMAISPNGLLCATATEKNVCLWNTFTGQLLFKSNATDIHRNHIRELVFGHNGQWIISADMDGVLCLWQVTSRMTLTPADLFAFHPFEAVNLAVTKDGHFVAHASYDKDVLLYEINNEPKIIKRHLLKGHTQSIRSVAFNNDGQVLASGSNDNLIRLWDVSRHKPLAGKGILSGHQGRIRSLAFSPNGRLLASGSDDLSVRIWDISSSVIKVRVLSGHSYWIWSVVFSPDGQKLVSGSLDRSIRYWDSTTGVNIDSSSMLNGITNVVFNPDLSKQQLLVRYSDGTMQFLERAQISDTHTWIVRWRTMPYILYTQECVIDNADVSTNNRKLLTQRKIEPQVTANIMDTRMAAIMSSVGMAMPDTLAMHPTIGYESEQDFRIVHYNQSAFEALKNKDYLKAVRLFEQLISFYPDDAGNYHNCACAYHLLGVQTKSAKTFQRADELFQEALKRSPGAIGVLVEYANFLRDRKQYAKALSMLEQVISSRLSSPEETGSLSYGEGELPVLPLELARELSSDGRIDLQHPKVFAFYLQVYCLREQRISQGTELILSDFQALVDSLETTKPSWFYYKLLHFSYNRCEKTKHAERSLEKSNRLCEQNEIVFLADIIPTIQIVEPISQARYSSAQTMGQQGQFRAAANKGQSNTRPNAKEEKGSKCLIM